MKKISLFVVFALVLGSVFLYKPQEADALMVSLNGDLAISQSFVNDSNITISTSGGNHTLGWSGVLSPARGGSGTSTAFTNGSLLFAGGSGVYSQDNANLFWDNTTDRLGIGTAQPAFTLDVAGGARVGGSLMVDGGGELILEDNDNNEYGYIRKYEDGLEISSGLQQDYRLRLRGDAIKMESDNDIEIIARNSGSVLLTSDATPERTLSTMGIGADSLILEASSGNYSGLPGGNIYMAPGTSGEGGITGHVFIKDPESTKNVQLVTDLLTNDNWYSFPDLSGTFGLLEADQEFTGTNTFSSPSNYFVSGTDSTIHVGADGIPGCLAIGDSDGVGVSYITVNDGVISATDSRPSNCN